MNKIIGATIGGTLIATALIIGYLDYSGTEYICNHCKKQYHPSVGQWIMGIHFPKKRYMKCPSCGNWGWHQRIRISDQEEF